MSKRFKHLREFSAMQGGDPFVGPPSTPDMAADDIDVPFSLNDLDQRKHLARLNSFVSQISTREYMNPSIPLGHLQEKLERIGITVRMPPPFQYIEDGAIMHIPILRFGGRFGMHPTEGWTDDDGFGDQKYVLELIFTQNKGMYSIDAEIIPQEQASEYDDEEPYYEEDDDYYDDDDEYMEEGVIGDTIKKLISKFKKKKPKPITKEDVSVWKKIYNKRLPIAVGMRYYYEMVSDKETFVISDLIKQIKIESKIQIPKDYHMALAEIFYYEVFKHNGLTPKEIYQNVQEEITSQYNIRIEEYENSMKINESAPNDPEIEKWIKANKQRFVDQYGAEKGKEVLYAKAWKMYNNKKD